MTTLELTPEQVARLHAILSTYLSDLRMEIANTDRREFRDGLKAEEEFLKGLIERLAGAAEPAAGSQT